MRSKILLLITLLSITHLALAQKKGASYQYTVDLTKVVDDKVYVELSTPTITSDEITFYLPKIVPGTYAIADYGRFVSDLQAMDKKGNKLTVEKLNDTNAWKIKTAKKLQKITYWVEDSYDTKLAGENIFQPAGTNIEENKNFVMNTSGFFGYFEGQKQVPFTFNVIRAQDFYGSTGLIADKTGEPLSKISKEKDPSGTKRVDTYTAENYDRLVDSPLMYSKADTAVIRVGNTEVLVGSYSPNSKITAKQIANSIKEILAAQKEYLGGTLPVNKYAFIFYFTDQAVRSYGALEHSYSSMYFMPERTIEDMNQQLRDVAAHEFFHIVTPLTIHSEEIHNFDFNNPKMSKHLWLYEGVTEYFAGNMQVKYGLITPQEYLDVIRQKMINASRYMDDVPFTDISKETLEKYKSQYQNVYEKGALIGMCLDINLRKLSNGKYGMQNLTADLGKKFGKSKAFQDDQLFDEIVKLTYPEIGEFLKRYVSGPEKLPLEELFRQVGVNFVAEQTNLELSLGVEQRAIKLAQVGEKPMLAIGNVNLLNDQGKALGLANDDVLLKINGETIPDLGPEVGKFIDKHQTALTEGATLSMTVLRKNEAGEQKEVELKAPVKKVERKKRFIITFNENATPEQLALRDSWLKP